MTAIHATLLTILKAEFHEHISKVREKLQKFKYVVIYAMF